MVKAIVDFNDDAEQQRFGEGGPAGGCGGCGAEPMAFKGY